MIVGAAWREEAKMGSDLVLVLRPKARYIRNWGFDPSYG